MNTSGSNGREEIVIADVDVGERQLMEEEGFGLKSLGFESIR